MRDLNSFRLVDLERRFEFLRLLIKGNLRRGQPTDTLASEAMDVHDAIGRKVHGEAA